MDDSILPHPSMIDRLVEVARRLRSIRRPAEAAELLEIAAAFSTHGSTLREEAERVRGEEGIDDFTIRARFARYIHATGPGGRAVGEGLAPLRRLQGVRCPVDEPMRSSRALGRSRGWE